MPDIGDAVADEMSKMKSSPHDSHVLLGKIGKKQIEEGSFGDGEYLGCGRMEWGCCFRGRAERPLWLGWEFHSALASWIPMGGSCTVLILCRDSGMSSSLPSGCGGDGILNRGWEADGGRHWGSGKMKRRCEIQRQGVRKGLLGKWCLNWVLKDKWVSQAEEWGGKHTESAHISETAWKQWGEKPVDNKYCYILKYYDVVSEEVVQEVIKNRVKVWCL